MVAHCLTESKGYFKKGYQPDLEDGKLTSIFLTGKTVKWCPICCNNIMAIVLYEYNSKGTTVAETYQAFMYQPVTRINVVERKAGSMAIMVSRPCVLPCVCKHTFTCRVFGHVDHEKKSWHCDIIAAFLFLPNFNFLARHVHM